MFTKNRIERLSEDDPVMPEQEEELDSVPALGLLRRPESRNGSNINKPSIISAGFELVGDLVSTGVVQVEGTVRGNLRLSAVTIGSTGEVVGTIECRTLHIKGRFNGQARCEELTLSADAAVDGTLSYSQMSAQRGARIKGELIKNAQASTMSSVLPPGLPPSNQVSYRPDGPPDASPPEPPPARPDTIS
jgi:cytoskeletal protein CcmA (bactofilin family)